VSDSFNSVGINQVRDQIVLNIKTKVKVAIPFYDSDIVVPTVVPITESIIVGEVPKTWLGIPGGILGIRN